MKDQGHTPPPIPRSVVNFFQARPGPNVQCNQYPTYSRNGQIAVKMGYSVLHESTTQYAAENRKHSSTNLNRDQYSHSIV